MFAKFLTKIFVLVQKANVFVSFSIIVVTSLSLTYYGDQSLLFEFQTIIIYDLIDILLQSQLNNSTFVVDYTTKCLLDYITAIISDVESISYTYTQCKFRLASDFRYATTYFKFKSMFYQIFIQISKILIQWSRFLVECHLARYDIIFQKNINYYQRGNSGFTTSIVNMQISTFLLVK